MSSRAYGEATINPRNSQSSEQSALAKDWQSEGSGFESHQLHQSFLNFDYHRVKEGGRFRPHLNPLPSRERDFIRDYAVNYYFRCSLVDFAYTRTAVGSITLALARSDHSRHPHDGIVD